MVSQSVSHHPSYVASHHNSPRNRQQQGALAGANALAGARTGSDDLAVVNPLSEGSMSLAFLPLACSIKMTTVRLVHREGMG